jgi:hypothetical protein
MSGYSVVHVAEIPEQDDGRVPMRSVRHHLGITGFGVNAWSLTGQPTEALAHLRQAIELSEQFRDYAKSGSDLDAIREEAAFQELVGAPATR